MSDLLTFHPGGAVTFMGVDRGRMKCLARTEDYAVIHVSGSTYWQGIGVGPGYSPARTEMWKRIGERWTLILEWSTTRKARPAEVSS